MQQPFFIMKKLLITLIVTLIAGTACYAQKDVLAINEQNKYTYFKVGAALPDIDAHALATYLKKAVPGLQNASAVKESNTTNGRGGVLVYKQGLVTGQEEGRVDYIITVDFKDSKYRLIITDFTFTPYQRNRYGVFAAVDNVSIPLEKSDVRLTKKQLSNYLERMGAFSAKLDKMVSDFVTKKTSVKSETQGLKKVDTQKW